MFARSGSSPCSWRARASCPRAPDRALPPPSPRVFRALHRGRTCSPTSRRADRLEPGGPRARAAARSCCGTGTGIASPGSTEGRQSQTPSDSKPGRLDAPERGKGIANHAARANDFLPASLDVAEFNGPSAWSIRTFRRCSGRLRQAPGHRSRKLIHPAVNLVELTGLLQQRELPEHVQRRELSRIAPSVIREWP